MAGETKYDVLTYFLNTIHATITEHSGHWLIVRETDVTVSGGNLPCLRVSSREGHITTDSMTGAVLSAGKMGVATLWPIGHMSTNVSPSKRRITVEAPYHTTSGLPSVKDNEWTIVDSSHVAFNGGYILTYAVNDTDYGEIYADENKEFKLDDFTIQGSALRGFDDKRKQAIVMANDKVKRMFAK